MNRSFNSWVTISRNSSKVWMQTTDWRSVYSLRAFWVPNNTKNWQTNLTGNPSRSRTVNFWRTCCFQNWNPRIFKECWCRHLSKPINDTYSILLITQKVYLLSTFFISVQDSASKSFISQADTQVGHATIVERVCSWAKESPFRLHLKNIWLRFGDVLKTRRTQ